MEASIGEVLVSVLVQFQIGEFEYTEGKPPRHEPINLSELPLIEKATRNGVSQSKWSQRYVQMPWPLRQGAAKKSSSFQPM